LISLTAGEAHLWSAFPDRNHDPAIRARQLAVLSPAERDRMSRFRFESGRDEYLVAHSLVRDVLSRYAPSPPGAWEFQTNQYGCPYIVAPAEHVGLRFNLSHTKGRVIVAVAQRADIGVDVERADRGGDLEAIADRFFSPPEVEQLKCDAKLFFDFWTLKESYIKARGMGLSIPLDSFSFSLSDPARPRITFHASCEDQPERWQFALQREEHYRVALSIACATPLRITEREIIPMAVSDL
jgi:4'-phosphopantetheinyl transferase